MKLELKNILVPIDFKDASVHAASYAYNMAKQLKSKLVFVNVIETPGFLSDFFASGNELVKITDKAKESLNVLVKSLVKEGDDIEVLTKVERGKPYQKILELAKTLNARMIILGENHQYNNTEQELGSTVYHVTLKSPVPVLTIKGDIHEMGDKIVVPLDLTRQTRKQLFSALAYGLNYNSRIYLVSSLVGGIKMRDSRIFRKLKQAKKTVEENGVECYTKLFNRDEEPPFRKVIKYADEINAGMILVMTHQEGYTHDNYIGAFAHHIINKSRVPVLSLTSSATDVNYNKVFTNVVDPVGMLTA